MPAISRRPDKLLALLTDETPKALRADCGNHKFKRHNNTLGAFPSLGIIPMYIDKEVPTARSYVGTAIRPHYDPLDVIREVGSGSNA